MKSFLQKLMPLVLVLICAMSYGQNSITTTFAGGNGHDGNMLDFTSIGTSDVTIDSLDFSISATAGTDAFVLVYYKIGTYVGFETNPTPWIRHDSIHVLSAGIGLPTRVHIGGLVIPQGQTYGLYLTTHSVGPDVDYTNGANTYSDANVTIVTGSGLGYPFVSNNTPRTWNGTIYYSLNNCTTPMLSADMSSYCEGENVIISAASSSGFYNWYIDATNDTLNNTSNPYSFTAVNSVTYYADALCPYADTAMMDVSAQASTFSGSSRGFWFTSPSDFVITGLRVPNDITGNQTIEVIKFTTGIPPSYSTTTNDFISLGYWQGIASTGIIPTNIIVHTGDVIGIVGVRGSTTSYVGSPYVSSIDGNSVTLERLGMQFDISTQQLHDVWTESGSNIGRVEMYYQAGYASTSVSLNVAVSSIDFQTTNATICQGDSLFLEGLWQTTAGTYHDTLLNIGGCDSIVETSLLVNPSYTNTIVSAICQGDSVFAEGNWQTTTGIYYDTIPTINSCDSIIELDLTVNPTYINTIITAICDGDSLFAEGAWQTTTGMYYDTLITINSCDSIFENNLTVNLNPIVDLGIDTIICNNQSILLDPGTFSSYLWSESTTTQTLLVDTNNFVVGNNTISVIVTDVNGCIGIDTIVVQIDNCMNINDLGFFSSIDIYPNPVSDLLNIEFNDLYNEVEVSIITIDGKILSKNLVNDNNFKIDFTEMPNGVYLLKLKSNENYAIYKIVH